MSKLIYNQSLIKISIFCLWMAAILLIVYILGSIVDFYNNRYLDLVIGLLLVSGSVYFIIKLIDKKPLKSIGFFTFFFLMAMNILSALISGLVWDIVVLNRMYSIIFYTVTILIISIIFLLRYKSNSIVLKQMKIALLTVLGFTSLIFSFDEFEIFRDFFIGNFMICLFGLAFIEYRLEFS